MLLTSVNLKFQGAQAIFPHISNTYPISDTDGIVIRYLMKTGVPLLLSIPTGLSCYLYSVSIALSLVSKGLFLVMKSFNFPSATKTSFYVVY